MFKKKDKNKKDERIDLLSLYNIEVELRPIDIDPIDIDEVVKKLNEVILAVNKLKK